MATPPLDLEPEFLALYERCRCETLVTIERMYATWQAARHISRCGIPGDVVECGVWRGGCAMLMAMTLAEQGDCSRELVLYDTFAGMPPPEGYDIEVRSGIPAQTILAQQPRDEKNHYWCVAGRAVVEQNLAGCGYPRKRIRLVEGLVEETLPGQAPERIALLRLDTDWHSSTRHELQHLWPRLSPGGVLLIDDYGYWAGCRKAVDEYFATLPAPPLLIRVDVTGRVAIKG